MGEAASEYIKEMQKKKNEISQLAVLCWQVQQLERIKVQKRGEAQNM